MAKHHTTVRFEPHIIAALDERGQRGPIVNRDLERLYTLYERALRRLRLTLDEACLIAHALETSTFDAKTAGMLPVAIRDAIELNDIAEKWNVDGAALLQKLSALDEFSCMAIIDAAERFWRDEIRNIDFRAAVKKYFLIREE